MASAFANIAVSLVIEKEHDVYMENLRGHSRRQQSLFDIFIKYTTVFRSAIFFF